MTLRSYQSEAVAGLREAIDRHGSAVYVLPTGAGKCLGAGTPVLMHSGEIKAVEHVKAGDLLMGPDSQPRRVLSTTTGFGPMYEIRPKRGEPWRCNADHVLTLVRTATHSNPAYPSQGSSVIDIPLSEWRNRSKTWKHRHKQFSVGVEWPKSHQALDPYLVGVLLGDGDVTRGRVSVTTADSEIVDYLRSQAAQWGLSVRASASGGRTPTYHLTSGQTGGKQNPITRWLRRYGISGETAKSKSIPHAYLISDRHQRLALLAGLLDTDGHLSKSVFEFSSASENLAHDTAFVARSIGLRALIAEKHIGERLYWRVSISGETDMIPTKIPRKRAAPRRQRKNALRTGFDVVPVGDGRWYGFELDDDGRFLLGDFTVTHNTVVAAEIARLASQRGKRTLLLVHRRELVKQAIETLSEACPGVSVGVEAAGWPAQPWATLQVGMVQSIARRSYSVNPDLVIVDEAHHTRAATWEKVLAQWPQAAKIGLTATPERLDRKGLGNHFATMVLGPPIRTLVEDGYLAPVRTLSVPSGMALSQVRRDRHGDYRQDDLRSVVNDEVIASAVDAYLDYAAGRRAIFFGIDVAHSKQVVAGLQARGVKAEHVDGTDPAPRRDRVMQAFRTGGIAVVGNCDLISEGYDAPSCDVVIMGAPTSSITRFLQQAGRAMRPGEGKEALILDLGGSVYELGLPDETRNWSLEDGEVKQRAASERTPLTCPNCRTVFRGQKCPHCATMVKEVPAPLRKEERVELQEVTRREPKMRRGELMRLLQAARRADNPRAALSEIAFQNGYKPGWVHHILKSWGIVAKSNGQFMENGGNR